MLGRALTFFQYLLSCLLSQKHPIEIATQVPYPTMLLILLTLFYLSFSKHLSSSNSLYD